MLVAAIKHALLFVYVKPIRMSSLSNIYIRLIQLYTASENYTAHKSAKGDSNNKISMT